MRRLRVSAEAEAGYRDILRQSLLTFGPVIRQRYRILIGQAYSDLLADPQRRGVKATMRDLHLYPLTHSRTGIAKADRINRPRHIIVFRYDDDVVEIVRLLHEAMDFPTRLS